MMPNLEETEDSLTSNKPPPNPSQDADDLEDESAPDFRQLTQKIPSRGIKDFEPHGTNLQVSNLSAARNAMYNVLAVERIASNVDRAFWDPESCGAWCENMVGKLSTQVGRSRRIEGRWVEGKDGKKLPFAREWLLPEEVLWLVDRGSLDMRWPVTSGYDDGKGEFDGLPMSLQALRTVAFRGGLTGEQFAVYQVLKRGGYVVLRAEDNWSNVPETQAKENPTRVKSWWEWWTTLIENNTSVRQDESRTRQAYGPILKPGLYRNYVKIFQQFELIPTHKAYEPRPLIPPTDKSPRITYHVYKPNAHFRKTAPGPPDVYVSVINARTQSFPDESELEALFLQTPYSPADSKNMAVKIRRGGRNVVLAVVDQGLTSFLRVADAGFENFKMYERKPPTRPKGGGQGPRKGGAAGPKGNHKR